MSLNDHPLSGTPGEHILYIVGNGFDLHHGVKSSYAAFGEYLREVDSDTYAQLERYFTVDEQFWGEFEEQLAHLDTDSLLDDATVFLASYGADDWSDSGHHDYEYELDRVVSAISSTLRLRFSEWVRKIEARAVGKLDDEAPEGQTGTASKAGPGPRRPRRPRADRGRVHARSLALQSA